VCEGRRRHLQKVNSEQELPRCRGHGSTTEAETELGEGGKLRDTTGEG
jgi:hypothetical protein